MLSHSVVSSSLRPHGLQFTRLLCPWGFSRREENLTSSRDLPNPAIEPRSPALQADPLPTKPNICTNNIYTVDTHTHTYIYKHSIYICISFIYINIYTNIIIYIYTYIHYYIYTHTFLLIFSSIVVYYRILNIVPLLFTLYRVVSISLSETLNSSLPNLPTLATTSPLSMSVSLFLLYR